MVVVAETSDGNQKQETKKKKKKCIKAKEGGREDGTLKEFTEKEKLERSKILSLFKA